MIFQNPQNQIHNHGEIVLHGDNIGNLNRLKCLCIWIDRNLSWKEKRNMQENIPIILAIMNKIKLLQQSCTLKQI